MRWDQQALDKLHQLITQDFTGPEIAIIMQTTLKSVEGARYRYRDELSSMASVVNNNGKPWPFPRVVPSGTIGVMKAQKAAKTLKQVVAPNSGQRWTEGDVEDLIGSFEEGIAIERIASDLGRTVHGCLGKLHALKHLKFNKDEMSYYIPEQFYYKVPV